jgi:thymidylate kinase
MKDEALSSSQILPRSRSVPFTPVASRPRLVSFSGVDGAGKSTQIAALCAAMDAAGKRVRVIRFWDDVARLHRFREAAATGIFKSERGVGAPGAPVNRRDKNVRSRGMTCVRLFLYLVDALSLRMTIKRALRSDFDVVLFDRFIYDELANLNLNHRAVRIYVRWIMALVPRPDISYLLDADPIEARARKPEYPLEFLYVNREAYLSLSRLIGKITVIGAMPVEEVKREIRRHGAELLTGKDRNHVS